MQRLVVSHDSRVSSRTRSARAGLCIGLSLLIAGSAAAAREPTFDEWLAGVRSEAVERGISSSIVASALDDLAPEPDILRQDRSQPKNPADFCGYMVRRLTSTRIARAKRMLEEHGSLLKEINAEFGIPARYIVSLWGLETNFGDYQGGHSVVRSLATLAFDPRRSENIRGQLFAALQILDERHLEVDQMKGSWAGAMGHVQFMPTTFLAYAVDYDGDGRKNIWGSVPDALASAANYLRQAGWRPGETWGRRIDLPVGMTFAGRTSPRRSVEHWRNKGVRSYGGYKLPASSLSGSIVLPRNEPSPAFLVYGNYRTILAWNHSTYFGISVGTLADRVSGLSSPRLCTH
jgi:membrane-bound lytic murein transglycosylase B